MLSRVQNVGTWLRRAATVAATAALACASLTAADAALAAPSRAASRGISPATTWLGAREVPGIGKLNAGGDAQILSVSCSSTGNCGAGGFYTDGAGVQQAFVANEVSRTWSGAQRVPGAAALNLGHGGARVNSVSCRAAGFCTAGGFYTDASGAAQAFVANETDGTWRSAEKVPGTANLNHGGNGEVLTVSCGSPGNCGAGGLYTDSAGNQEAFVASLVNGTWSKAREVPGTSSLNKGGSAQLSTLSCSSAGNCGGGGYYVDGSGSGQAFVVSETKGSWGTALEVPGTAALNRLNALIVAISCPSAGNCGAGGMYTLSSGHQQAFVVSEVSGHWRTAVEVPGTAALNRDGYGALTTVSCHAAGNCAAGGIFTEGTGNRQAFVVSQARGKWSLAKKVPGMSRLNVSVDAQPADAQPLSVSCGAPGNCTAGGFYTDKLRNLQAFVVSEINGSWRSAIELPKSGTLNRGGTALVNSLSCTSAQVCSGGGAYASSTGAIEAFVFGET